MNAMIRKSLRSPLSRFAVAAVLVTGAAATTLAFAHGGLGGEGRMGHHGGAGMMEDGGGRWMGRGLDRMLDSVQATEAQRTQIRQIAEGARRDLQAQRAAGGPLRDQALAAFAQPTVDAAQVEAVRRQMLAQHDASSQRMSQAMVQIAQVLTPEQRTQLAQRMKERQDRSRGGHRHGPGAAPQRPANPTS